jgi:hypothetical protein
LLAEEVRARKIETRRKINGARLRVSACSFVFVCFCVFLHVSARLCVILCVKIKVLVKVKIKIKINVWFWVSSCIYSCIFV